MAPRGLRQKQTGLILDSRHFRFKEHFDFDTGPIELDLEDK